MKSSHRVAASLIAFVVAAMLSGCVGVSFDPQERSFSSAVDDFNAKTQLNAMLLGESASLFANVSLTIIEGRVHLSGTVPRNEDRLTATRLAWSTPHVTEVANDIEITDQAGIGDIARDRWISTQVRSRILTDRSIRDVNYTIDTQNRVVYILGIAQNQGELDRVLAHARTVTQARRVVNYALLKDDPRRFAKPGRYVDAEAPITPSEPQ